MNENEQERGPDTSPSDILNSGVNGGLNMAANQIGKKATESIGKKTAQEGVKQGAKAAATAATAAADTATAGTAEVAKAAIEAGIALGKIADAEAEMSKGTDGAIAKILIAVGGILILFTCLFGSIIHLYMPSPVSSYIENQYLAVESDATENDGSGFFGFLNTLFRSILGFAGYDYERPGRYEVVYEDSLQTDVDIIKKGLTKAYEKVAPKEVKSVIKEKDYDYDLTWASWLENENPYLTEEGEWNVNFAEFMIILNESTIFAANEFIPNDYQEFMKDQENLQYLYYLTFDEKWRYIENYTEETRVQVIKNGKPVYDKKGKPVMTTKQVSKTRIWDVPAGQDTLTTSHGTYSLNSENTTLWAVVTIFKYDLLDLCDMVGVDIYGTFQYSDTIEVSSSGEGSISPATNLDMYMQTDAYEGYMMYEEGGLSYQELLLRHYAFDVDLGPTEKTPFMRHHHNGIDDQEYGTDENGNPPSYQPGDTENISASTKYLIEWLKSKVGNPYSQIDRDDGYHFDCSSLVYYAYKQIGINLAYKGSNTAASIAQGLNASGKEISSSNLQPGDIVFYSHSVNDRYKNITHVAIYVGNGRVIDARGSKYGVVERPLPTKNIVMCARPMK